MVQESRSMLIQQLFRGGFKEDDDEDEDEDEAHELVKRHPSGDERQSFGRKEHSHQELIQGDWEAGRVNNKGSKCDATKNQVFGSNAVNSHKVLASRNPWKDLDADPQHAEEDCLQPEKEIIEEGSKKLLQIHSEFLLRQCHPSLQPTKGLGQQEPDLTPTDNCFTNICHKQPQHWKGGEDLNPSSRFPPSKLGVSNKEENDQLVRGDAQPSYGTVEDALLSTQRDFTSPVSPGEDERRLRCFAVLNNAKVAARELNANISIPIFSTGFEKKSSLSGCTESLASDRGSSTDSVNGGDEVIQDVTSAENPFNFDEQKGDLLTPDERTLVEAAARTGRVEEVVQHIESAVPVIELDTVQSGKNWGSEFTDNVKDWRIETTAEYRQAKNETACIHVELLSNVQETVEFKGSAFEQATAEVIDKISDVLDSSIVGAEELSSGARSCYGIFMNPRKYSALFVHPGDEREKKVEDCKTAPTKKVGFPVSTALHCFSAVRGAAEPARLAHAERAEQTRDAEDLTRKIEDTRLNELPLKRCADAASLRTCLCGEANMGNDPIVAADNSKEKDDTVILSSPTASAKKLADTARTVCTPDKGNKVVMFSSTEGKLRSPFGQVTETSVNAGPIFVQADRRGLTGEPSEVGCTPTTTCLQAVETPSSPLTESLPTISSSLHTATARVTKRSKSNGTCRKSKKKKKTRVQHQDARTMVFVRSDTRVAYNNGPNFPNSADRSLPQEHSQHNTVANVVNPSLYDFSGSPKPFQAPAFMSHETDVHLMQAQTSAKDAMVAATSALAQSHSEWSRMQTQAAHSRLTVVRESQIAAIAASVAAAAVVAKAAVEAAKAIQEASKEFLGQLGGPSQVNFGKSGISRSANMLARGRGNISEVTDCQPLQVANPNKISTAVCKRKKQKPGASSANSKDEVVRAGSREKSVRFMKEEVVTDNQKVLGKMVCKKRTIHEANQTQRVNSLQTSHAELRDPGGELLRSTNGALTGHEADELVEVMTEEAGFQYGWFVAKILMKTDKEAFVQYNELLRPDGSTPRTNLFPLSSFRQEDAYGRIEQGDGRWLRPLHPFSKAWKLCRGSMLPQTWAAGARVDAYSNGGWWEGLIVETEKADEMNIKIHFSGGKGVQVVKAWDVRPSLIWAGDDWRTLKENCIAEEEPPSKRTKLNAEGNAKSKREEKMQSLKILADEEPCQPIADPIAVLPRVSRRSAEAAAKKKGSGNLKLKTLNCTRKVTFSPNSVEHKSKQVPKPARSAQVVRPPSWRDLKKTASPTSFAANTGSVSTRLQLKTEAEKRKKVSSLVASKVIQRGAKSVSTRCDTMKLKSNVMQTKLLKALKNTSKRKPPRLTQKVCMRR